MIIEIHMIQNHSPANLNRDDLGAPKSCLFGGVTRARISSQCLKRSIRRSDSFQQMMENNGGVRTRRLITKLAEKAHGEGPVPDDLSEFVKAAFEKGGVKTTDEGEEPNSTRILMFIPQSTLDAMVEAVRRAWGRKDKPEKLCEALAELLGQKATVPDIALCGRMIELDPGGLFRRIKFRVDAALSAAHAISTHEVLHEVDYFTAVDDLAVGTGAGHVNEAMFTSACFYKYFCTDWDQLVENLDNDTDLASLTLRQFTHAAAMTTPSGKQKSFAAFNPPDGILVEVKTDRCMPVNYANAFADPVPPGAPRGLVGESIARLGQHMHDIVEGYGIPARRLWFSPAGRYPLTYVADKEDRPALEPDACVATLDALVDRMMEAVHQGAHIGEEA